MEYNGFTIPTWLMDIFLFIGVIVIIELLTIGCWYYIAWKFNASGDLKQYNFLIRIFLYLLAVPVIIFGLLPMLGIPNSLFDDSDVLAYYGAVIGGGVTVLGVYWTFKYESELSKEERRENSLPILRFNFISNPGTPDEDSEYDIHLNKDLKQNDKYEIVDKNVIYNMEIRNIGLQPAILSSISLLSDDCWALPTDDPKIDLSNFLILNDSKDSECKINLIILLSFQEYDNYNPQQIPEEKDHRRDYLLVVFEDLYSNKYKYKIPIVDKQIGKEHYFLFETDEMSVLPLKIEKSES